MSDVIEFFRDKLPWSKYKDLILDYYLQPYLAKVAWLKRPIVVVDCFAGAGQFEDGNAGSPLIISKHLADAAERGTEVRGIFIEKDDELFSRLKCNAKGIRVPVTLHHGDFHQYIDEIVELATTHTVFLYVDPIHPGDLKFDDLSHVYAQLKTGKSVETLVNFLSPGFIRRGLGLRPRAFAGNELEIGNLEVIACNEIVGGDYWQQIIFDEQKTHDDRVEEVATEYAKRLGKWFPFVIKYPIKEKYEHPPKYHLIFGSRHGDAIELMNRAMVTARREFVGAQFVDGLLFPNQPQNELVNEQEIEDIVVHTLHQIRNPMTWKQLRVEATIAKPCRYTESEWNRGIKQAIIKNRIRASVSGSKIEQNAILSPLCTT
ncbi:MAG: three-Cys-motif partner protein TcmP [Phycisphaerales bacterium]